MQHRKKKSRFRCAQQCCLLLAVTKNQLFTDISCRWMETMAFTVSLERTHRYNTRKNPTKFKLEKDPDLFPRTLIQTCVIPYSTPLNLIIEDPENRAVVWGDIIIVKQNGINLAKCDKCAVRCSMYIKDIYVPDGARVIGDVSTILIEFFQSWNHPKCSCPMFLHLVGYANKKEINKYILLKTEDAEKPYTNYISVGGYLTKKEERITHEEGSSDESAESYTITTDTESYDTDAFRISSESDTSNDINGFPFSRSEESGPEEDSVRNHLHTHEKYLVRKLTRYIYGGKYDFFTGKNYIHKRGKYLAHISNAFPIPYRRFRQYSVLPC
jgi:hypothetical protein